MQNHEEPKSIILFDNSKIFDFFFRIRDKEVDSIKGELFIFIPMPVFKYELFPKIVDLTITPTIFLFW